VGLCYKEVSFVSLPLEGAGPCGKSPRCSAADSSAATAVEGPGGRASPKASAQGTSFPISSISVSAFGAPALACKGEGLPPSSSAVARGVERPVMSSLRAKDGSPIAAEIPGTPWLGCGGAAVALAFALLSLAPARRAAALCRRVTIGPLPCLAAMSSGVRPLRVHFAGSARPRLRRSRAACSCP